jgi:hypothetical protein
MTLANTLLRKLADWRPDTPKSTLTVEAGWTAELSAEQNDALACKVWELTLRKNAPVDDLETWANQMSQRASALVGPLKLLELDGASGTAQLRSESPATRDDAVFYYELLLQKSGTALVRRFRASSDRLQKREQVGFVQAHESLARFVEDVTA